MKPSIHDTTARQHSGEPSPIPGRGGKRNNRPGKPGAAEADGEIAELINRSTQDLRVGWHKLHRTGPPLGLCRNRTTGSLPPRLKGRADGGPAPARRPRLKPMERGWKKGL